MDSQHPHRQAIVGKRLGNRGLYRKFAATLILIIAGIALILSLRSHSDHRVTTEVLSGSELISGQPDVFVSVESGLVAGKNNLSLREQRLQAVKRAAIHRAQQEGMEGVSVKGRDEASSPPSPRPQSPANIGAFWAEGSSQKEDESGSLRKIGFKENRPLGYSLLNCSMALTMKTKVINLIAAWEICGLAGGSVSGPREAENPGSVACVKENKEYGCVVMVKMEVPPTYIIPRILNWGARPTVPASSYQKFDTISLGGDAPRAAIHSAIVKYVLSTEYQARVKTIMGANLTGIIIPAGGPKLVTNLLVTLKVLRGYHKSKLPVEVMWQSADEMDTKTWQKIQSLFSPIRGIDISTTPHPVPGLHRKGLSPKSYTGKVYSLLVSEFRHVLMIDADSMPTQPPEVFFLHPQYLSVGNMFWPSAWQDKVRDRGYTMHGLTPSETKKVINAGKGYSPRDTESGQVLIDRGKHLDVLEYLLWINSYPEKLKGSMWGDKDTFGLAFAVAGKAHLYFQVAVPPAGLFHWRKDMLLIKATQQKDWGWQLIGMLQHDTWGRPAFIHRTIDKYSPEKNPTNIELITAPITLRWSEYFLNHDNMGPTKGVPWDYVVPANAVTELVPTKTASWVHEVDGELVQDSFTFSDSSAPDTTKCPVPTFVSVWTMAANGLPIDLEPAMMEACLPVLERLLGPREYEHYKVKGWLEVPTLRYLDREHMSGLPKSWKASDASTPLPAWRPDFNGSAFCGPFCMAVKAAYQAHGWIMANKHAFPILKVHPK
ncbi:hypothetical protein CEUSTIGMA_g4294.t1 [Chlamydomonas eustigma]|uniref:Nucleotide-diphospho-sugar transferase domain-containing protein n=1 Tax=Chlamydomonas eustigma TaxID=1157962 RepID=A0A250X195_9CHLO|nr:hypothetical protein CEUSTIGMA_g4294.t1 [Chlamydomonas eustigma]|eukprot:GAX76848.1 hypothetical protein CEUSTIGMA_g4294.t1 [Chlamydomonas eustigma]